MKTLDVSGLSCPEPVVRTMAALKNLPAGESIAVLADSATARDNVLRTAQNHDCAVVLAADGQGFRLTITRKA